MPGWNQSFYKVAACATVLLGLASCSGGGSSGGSTTAPPPAGSVTIAGTVSGTVIKVLRADTNVVISQADTASLLGPPPFPFTLSNIPIGVPVKAFFFSAGETFPLYVGNPSTNVFTVLTAGPVDLGFVTMGAGRATPQNQPSNVILGVEIPIVPPGIEPPPATLTAAIAALATGSVIVDFAVQNFTIGGQGQQHLHLNVDGGATTYHFFNGSTNEALNDTGQLSSDVQWQSISSFRLNNLSVGPHSVTAKLATASNIEFTNTEANPPAVNFTVTLPAPETLTITSPAPQDVLPSGPVLVSFTVQNFTIGNPGLSHVHIYLDGGAASHFYNGTTNQVVDGNGNLVANITWQSITSFQITGFSNGSHTIRLRLADGAEQELRSAEAIPPDLIITIQAPPSPPTMTIISPAQGAPPLPTGPVLVTFDIQNSPVPPSDTQPRMYFFVDGDTTPYKFYDGPGILEDGSSSGVRYLGVHTHFVHWRSRSSIQLNALASGSHEVKFVLVDLNEAPLPGTEKTLAFSIAAETGGFFSLQKVVGGLNVPVAMATSPDGGTIFVNEQVTGNIRVVTPKTTLPWQLQAVPFATLPVNSNGREQGLLGIAVDPNFSVNGFVYVYYTADAPTAQFGLKNRVVRLTSTTDLSGNTVANSSPPLVILDDIPANFAHNGGIIHFGPDGLLYIIVGENEVASDAQDLTSLRGKILRVNPADGSAPIDNPFFSNTNANAKIYSLGHRNSFGFTFHSHTNDLWETENGTDVPEHDEINRILARGNYGWPLILGIGNDPSCPNCINPIFDSMFDRFAPTGIVAFREDSSVYPAQYHNNLLFADFNFGQLHRIVLGGAGLTDLVSHSIACDCGQGGLIAVMHGMNVPGQDGYIYVSNATGSIFRVVPP